MYGLARLFLIASAALGAYCTAIFVACGWPATGWGLAIVAFACGTNKARGRLTALGSARWADENDMRHHRMLYAEEGLIIGRMP